MTIQFHPDWYFVGLWFVPHDEDLPVRERMDWMAAVWREQAGEPWKVRYRFRYHTGGEEPDAHDKKSWYGATMQPEAAEDRVEEAVTAMAEVVAAKNSAPLHYVPVHGDGRRALELLEQQDWAHLSTMPLDDEEDA